MRLLFDAQLSWRLEKKLAAEFPGSLHVKATSLPHPASDGAIWEFALRNGYVIVTRDEDFIDLSNTKGQPPQVVFLRVINPSTAVVAAILLTHAGTIRAFIQDSARSLLHLY